MLEPALTPPIVKPSEEGGSNLITPEVVITFPVAGAPRPMPGVILVMVPLLTVVTIPPALTLSPEPMRTTPKDRVVAGGTEIVPSAAIATFAPALTPPIPPEAGGRKLIVPEEVIGPPSRPTPVSTKLTAILTYKVLSRVLPV
jgi:hypothetical protein